MKNREDAEKSDRNALLEKRVTSWMLKLEWASPGQDSNRRSFWQERDSKKAASHCTTLSGGQKRRLWVWVQNMHVSILELMP